MDEILNDVVPDEDLKKYERIYFDLVNKQVHSIKAQFEYAWCLVKSKYAADIRKGIFLLEDVYSQDVAGRRNYLYFLSIGYTRIKEYTRALKYCRAFLEIEPTNSQVQKLENEVKRRLNQEGKFGMAITMAGVLIMGGLVSLGVALARN